MFEASDISQSRRAGSRVSLALVIEVFVDDAELLMEAVAAAADVDANDEPALGGCGSGVILVSKVSHAAPPSGLKLLLRSPRPSSAA